ncbi:MAG: DoxX family protein [Pseudomonadota bacterium]|jgi:putative oxidoreductase|nr:DoxX family protein [Pseudomonadota bacterium]
MNTVTKTSDLAGRIGLSALFLIAGLGKIGHYAGTQGYMESVGVPGGVLPAVIALEVLGGLAILLGFYTRTVAVLLAGFSLASALLFHADVQDPTQQVMFLKNIAIAGGFLLLAGRGAGEWSLDARLQGRSDRKFAQA